MPNRLQLRTGTGAPTAASFLTSEPAWDSSNGDLYIKNAAGSMVRVGPQKRVVQALGNSGAARTLTLSDAYDGVITTTLNANCAFTMPTAATVSAFRLLLVQDATGGWVPTFSTVTWADGSQPSWTTDASTFVVLSFISNGSVWYGYVDAQPQPPLSPYGSW